MPPEHSPLNVPVIFHSGGSVTNSPPLIVDCLIKNVAVRNAPVATSVARIVAICGDALVLARITINARPDSSDVTVADVGKGCSCETSVGKPKLPGTPGTTGTTSKRTLLPRAGTPFWLTVRLAVPDCPAQITPTPTQFGNAGGAVPVMVMSPLIRFGRMVTTEVAVLPV